MNRKNGGTLTFDKPPYNGWNVEYGENQFTINTLSWTWNERHQAKYLEITGQKVSGSNTFKVTKKFEFQVYQIITFADITTLTAVYNEKFISRVLNLKK